MHYLRYLLLILIISFSFSETSIGHTRLSQIILPLLRQAPVNIEPITTPIFLIGLHQLADRYVSESNISIGSNDILLNIVFVFVGYINTPEPDKSDYIYCAFWGNSPDIADKIFNLNLFHNESCLGLIKYDRDSQIARDLFLTVTFRFDV